MAAVQTRAETYESRLGEGRTFMASNQPERAAKAFRAASNLARENPEPLLLMAEAHRAAGNDAAAILALKEAEAIAPGNDPVIQKQMVDLYLGQNHVDEAIAALVTLRDAEQLSDKEILALARLQARNGDPQGAFKSLEPIQTQRPDDPEAKTVEAEILLVKGDEVLAAKLMDRLIEENPNLIAAHLLRVRYFLNSGYPEVAEQDIATITGADAKKPEVVLLHARILAKLEHHEQAAEILTQLVEEHPDNTDALGMLAEAKLNIGKNTEAQALVDRVLRIDARAPRALYVRGRASEIQGDKRSAEESYGYALSADPHFAPALSRMWRMQQEGGEKAEAQKSLEQLYKLGEASLEEKIALAEIYAQGKTNSERGLKIVDELLKREPGNPKYVALKAALTPAPVKKKSSGPIILRGGRH
ncbi:tetratricopeptide repeat protein [Hyalangium versicolor]|uniref:tetratricopeptide repeat protein n=1 Tax=Hyalangium versicolor TaxID=2861190 RepID=UPI001CCAD429|nr:tetratricopeptide repeat protein [Hyalangium versicolor]